MRKFEKTKVRVQPVLKLYLDLSKTNYLHFGLWDKGAELNLPNFQKAQENYARNLIGFVPNGVKNILDVGCGVGGNALAFAAKGFIIESISPDPYQKELFIKNTNGGIPFYLTTLEDFKTSKKYDLILMSESVQYINEKDIFLNAKRLLKEGGYLLTSDYYKLKEAEGVQNLPGHFLQDFMDEAEKNNFTLIKEEDITRQILPTLDYGNMVYKNYIKPVLDCILTTIQVHLKPLYYILSLALRIKIKGQRLKQIMVNNVVPLDAETFKKYLNYRIHLFKKMPG